MHQAGALPGVRRDGKLCCSDVEHTDRLAACCQLAPPAAADAAAACTTAAAARPQATRRSRASSWSTSASASAAAACDSQQHTAAEAAARCKRTVGPQQPRQQHTEPCRRMHSCIRCWLLGWCACTTQRSRHQRSCRAAGADAGASCAVQHWLRARGAWNGLVSRLGMENCDSVVWVSAGSAGLARHVSCGCSACCWHSADLDMGMLAAATAAVVHLLRHLAF